MLKIKQNKTIKIKEQICKIRKQACKYRWETVILKLFRSEKELKRISTTKESNKENKS